MREAEVVIAGAGPTGLVLALWLTRLGVRVRIVDKTSEPGTTSRAVVVQARTLELYRQIGLADTIVQNGLKFAAANLWAAGRKAGRAVLGEIGRGLSPFPYLLMFPQDEHERLLIDRLAGAGVEIERSTELIHFEDAGDRVLVRLRRPDGVEEECRTSYLAGCDGAHSSVRQVLRISFPGGTYAHLFYVADVKLDGPVADGELHIALDDADFLGVFPMKGDRCARLIGSVRAEPEAAHENLAWEDVSQSVVQRMRIRVERVNWFSTYHVHHRVAERFQTGRVFLLGDAAHIHSPVGGQGMNTGIGDAVNLAWKLAAVLSGHADSPLLETYEPERIAFARRLVATTDRIFALVTSNARIARRVRLDVVPRLVPALFGIEAVRRFMFRTVSQTAVRYRGSPLSAGAAAGVHGGDRLPWVRIDGASSAVEDNFTPLASLDWQVHVYGDPAPELPETCRIRGLALHAFPWSPAAEDAGLRRNALYLVRPDAYVALADPDARPAALERYLDERGLRPGTGSARS
ncbi:MAG TPA: FAD-dependent monooxygenase [Thermoanaerobaculia bacterium]|jgi:2-polyprenyl-6-methoxyphenol hydroxylase-like FAD-dependent oxidoreductase